MKIPKFVFQTSVLRMPPYLTERIQFYCQDWEYKHFLDDDIIEFIKQNPLEEFSNSIEVFHSFKIGAHKADFFRYYCLYVKGGVYIDSDAVPEKPLDEIVDDYDFFTVESSLKNNSMFNGFVGCTPKHPIIYQALKHIYSYDKEKTTHDYFCFCKELYVIIKNYDQITNYLSSTVETSEIIKKQQICIFNEEIVNDRFAVSKKNDDILLSHYYNKNYFIPSLTPLEKRKIEKNKPLTLGITLDLPPNANDFFSNGIRQNVLYLAELFLNIGYETHFIVPDKRLASCKETEYNKIFYRNDFKVTKLSELLVSNFDVIFVLSFELERLSLKILKYMGAKIIYYACGNSYFIDTENILYSQHKSVSDFPYPTKNEDSIYDQIWSIPQMYHVNKSYFEILYRSTCIEVPFVWSPKSVSIAALSNGVQNEDDFLYTKKEETKKIVIFEPNLSIMKWCLPALLICENAYRKDENKRIEKVYLNNIVNHDSSINQLNLDSLNKIVKKLDLFTNQKISIEVRFNSLIFMKTFADIVVSHQMHNPLNYLYLDLAWMGWPIIHNAHLCKDVGYYYEDFDYETGATILNEVISTHDAKKEEYLLENRKVISRYIPTNKELQKKYKNLIENLFSEQ